MNTSCLTKWPVLLIDSIQFWHRKVRDKVWLALSNLGEQNSSIMLLLILMSPSSSIPIRFRIRIKLNSNSLMVFSRSWHFFCLDRQGVRPIAVESSFKSTKSPITLYAQFISNIVLFLFPCFTTLRFDESVSASVCALFV